MEQIKLDSKILSELERIYANNQRELHRMCNKEIAKFGGLSQKDMDDFYSRAGYELSIAAQAYDLKSEKTFFEYAHGVIRFSVLKEMTSRNRAKRQNIFEEKEKDAEGNIVKTKKYIPNISIETPITDEDGLTIGDTLQSDFNMEKSFIENESPEEYSKEMKEYLNRLSKVQVEVLKLLADGYSAEEIRKKLHIDNALYNDCVAAIKSYRNTKCIVNLIRRRSENVG